MTPDDFLQQEPPTGSVVAIDWGEPYQEVWVSNRSNIGNWYTPDIPLGGDAHPSWYDVLRRAKGRTITLLAPAPEDAYAAGFDAGVAKVSEAVTSVAEEMRLGRTGRYPAPETEGGAGPTIGCDPSCWTPVNCPSCGSPLPPRGRSVPLAMTLAPCCDEARMSETLNPRHLWNKEEAPDGQ